MTDEIPSYEFTQQAEVRRPRIRLSVLIFAAVIGVGCVVGVVFREPLLEYAGSFLVPPPPPEVNPDDVIPPGVSEDEKLMYILTDVGGEAAKNAIQTIVAKHDQRYAAVLLEALIAAEESPGGYPRIGVHHYFKGLMQLIGGPSLAPERGRQPLSENFLTWYTSSDLVCPDGYTGWKGHLLARIDPINGELIYEGVPTSVRIEEVKSAGREAYGPQSLDKPPMILAAEAVSLTPNEPVFGIEISGDARAYPERMLQRYATLNDVVGSLSVTIAYCPVCGAVTAYDGRATDGKTYTFDTSGLLYRSNRLLLDRETRSLWSQLIGRPIIGPAVSSDVQLNRLPIVTTTWADWKSQYPQSRVLDVDTTEIARDSFGATYAEYFATGNPAYSFGPQDDRITPKSRVYGVQIGRAAKAYPLDELTTRAVVNDAVGEQSLVLVSTRNSIPVETTMTVQSGRRGDRRRSFELNYNAGGEVRAFARGDRTFHPGPDPDTLVDNGGDEWKVTSGALVTESGESLPRIAGVQAYWFAWSQIHVDTDIYRDSGPSTAASAPGE